MKILFAPDSFKGSASAKHITKLLEEVTQRHFPECEMISVPVGDGGEGTVEAVLDVLRGHYVSVNVTGPLGKSVQARYGVFGEESAIIEMAQASGLPLIPVEKLDPMQATSYGTGELLMHAIQSGCRNIYLLIGGSATNDGGMGAASALGIRFLDNREKEVPANGSGLIQVKSIDVSGLCSKLADVHITIMSDVTNILLGPYGATYVYGKQKGATEQIQEKLEQGMENYIKIVEDTCKKELRNILGIGAAGGIAVPLLAFANVSVRSGIETVLELLGFEEMLQGVDLVVTGEGRLDGQSSCGKVLSGIGGICQKRGIPVVAIAGGIGDGAEKIYEKGVSSAIACVNNVMSLKEALEYTDKLFCQAADQMYRFIKVGITIEKKQKDKR